MRQEEIWALLRGKAKKEKKNVGRRKEKWEFTRWKEVKIENDEKEEMSFKNKRNMNFIKEREKKKSIRSKEQRELIRWSEMKSKEELRI